MGWRGDMQATSSAGSQLNEWAGLTADQEALLAALQVRYPSFFSQKKLLTA